MQLAPGGHQVCTRPLAKDSIWDAFPYLHHDFPMEVVFSYRCRDWSNLKITAVGHTHAECLPST